MFSLGGGGNSGIIRIYKIGQGSVGGNIYIPPLPDLSRYFQNFSQGGGIWINLDYENRSQLSRGNIYALTNEIAPRMHGEI